MIFNECIPSIAGTADGNPVREEITLVAAIINIGFDSQARKLSLGCVCGGNAGLTVSPTISTHPDLEGGLVFYSQEPRRQSRQRPAHWQR